MDLRGALIRITAAAAPSLTRDLLEFRRTQSAFEATRPLPTTVAVVGLTPGEGRTTVSALLALSVAGWSGRRVAVLDTVTARTGRQPEVAGVPTVLDVAGRSVTAMLGGDVSQGRLAGLLDRRPPGGDVDRGTPVVTRRRLRTSTTPGAAVAVLSLPPGGAGFQPQFVEQTLTRLRQRADLVIIDTPAGPSSPALHGVLEHADHFVMVVRGDGDIDRRIDHVLDWLDAAPGRSRRRTVTAVVVHKGGPRRGWRPREFPVVLLARDEGLRRRAPARLGRRAVISGLTLATAVARAADGASDPVSDRRSDTTVSGMGSPPHPGLLREPVPQR